VNKRNSILTLFVVGTLLLGLMGAIAALAAPSAATADGTVSLDAEWYSTSGSLKITVTDADLDILIATSTTLDLSLDGPGEADARTLPLDPGNRIIGTPVIIRDTDCTASPLAADSNLSVSVFNASTGDVLVSSFTGAHADATICYNVSAKDTTTITLTSTQDATTFVASPLTLTQTTASGNVYGVTVTLNTTASTTTDPFALRVLNGDTITVTYTDAVNAAGATNVKLADTARVETNATLISAVGPLDDTSTQLRLPQFTATLNDSDSGVAVGSVFLLIDRDVSGLITYDSAARRANIVGTDPTALLPFFTTAVLDTTKLQAEVDAGNTEIVKPSITGTGAPGTDVTISFTPTTEMGAVGTESDISWFIVVFDKAGNATLSDSDPASIDDLGADGAAGGGDDGLQLLAVDEPTILRVDRLAPSYGAGKILTGNYWDPSTSTVKNNRKSSIEVQFSEKMDSTSVSAGDFTVDGLTPVNAEVFSKLETSVFLTLGYDLAPYDKPGVALVSAVSDKAGNTSTSIAAIEATDKIAPTFTVTVDKSLTNKGISIAIASNEAVSGNLPTVELYKKGDAVTVEKIMPVVVTGTDTWKSEVTTELNVAQGDISIYVKGKDLAQNTGTVGKKDSTAAGSVLFKYDTVINAPTFDPVKSVTTTLTSVETSAPFIRAVYDEAVSITKAEFGVKGATLTDVTSVMFSSDEKTWIYPTSGLTVGEGYEFKIDAKDTAGNEKKAQSTEFIVKERAKVDIAMVPGRNLVSLPGSPAAGEINLVGIPDEVTEVITYDPTPAGIAAGGPWLAATRPEGGGDLTGTLTSLDSVHAYWMKTTSTAPIKVEIPQQGIDAVPPSIPVVNGWNLVPVASLTGETPAASPDTSCGPGKGGGVVAGCKLADQYFGSTAWITAYTFNTTANRWVKLLPSQLPADTVAIGKGYWLYVGKDGVLVP
jgi:hypothetical protein